MVHPTLSVMVDKKHKAGHPEGVMSRNNLVLVEAGSEGVSWEGDILGEVWSCVAALRDEGRIDL